MIRSRQLSGAGRYYWRRRVKSSSLTAGIFAQRMSQYKHRLLFYHADLASRDDLVNSMRLS